MVVYVAAGVAIASAANQAYQGAAASRKAAHNQETANAQNIALHTMTPEEQSALFSEGNTKINTAYKTGLETTGRALAQRNLGGTAAMMPFTKLARDRTTATGQLWSDIIKQKMAMKASTPTIQPVPVALNPAGAVAGGVLNSMSPYANYFLGNKMGMNKSLVA